MAGLYAASEETPTMSSPQSSSAGTYSHFVKSQEHLLRTSEHNPEPTMMPPPAAGLASTNLGERHVIVFLGLPARGKQFMAERLARYLEFFHGAVCQIFDLSSPELNTDVAVGDALARFLESEDESATTQIKKSAEGIDDDSQDRWMKNVDSGRIAILDSSDGFETRTRAWAGTSKFSRYEMSRHLQTLRVRVKLLFIEVIVRDDRVVRAFLTHRLRTDVEPARMSDTLRTAAAPAAHAARTLHTADAPKGSAALAAKIAATEKAIESYGRVYVSIQDDGSEDDLSYVKLVDYGNKVITNRIRGFLLMQIVKYLSHVHPRPRVVYLSRHGQSVYNQQKKIGGNPGLTEAGEAYARWLGKAVPGEVWARPDTTSATVAFLPTDDEGDGEGAASTSPDGRPLFGRLFPCWDRATGATRARAIAPARLWTSTLKRTIDTARHIPHPVLELRDGGVWHQMSPRVYRNLDEIFAGDCEGMTYEEIEKTFNHDFVLRKRDKLGYRYPRGESYLDLIARLDPLMHELESYKEPLLVVSHQATLRILYSYLVGGNRADAPKVEIPLHTLIKITWDGWRSISEERISMAEATPGLQDDGQKEP